MRVHSKIVVVLLVLVAALGGCHARQLTQVAPAPEMERVSTKVGVWRANLFPLNYQTEPTSMNGGQYTGEGAVVFWHRGACMQGRGRMPNEAVQGCAELQDRPARQLRNVPAGFEPAVRDRICQLANMNCEVVLLDERITALENGREWHRGLGDQR